MRRGLFIVGLVLAILGAGLLAWGVIQTMTSVSAPDFASTGSAPCVSFPSMVSSGPVTVSWSGADSSTSVHVIEFGPGGCSTPTGTTWTQNGSSGSLSFTAQVGNAYAITQTGNSGLTLNVQIGAITYTQIIGAVLLVPGAALAGLGAGMRPKVRPEDAMAETAAAPEETAETAPSASPAAYAAPPPPPPASGAAAPGAAVAGAAAGSAAASAPAAPAAPTDTGRPPILCGHCGKWNEPWLSTCRYCKRPLMSTEST